MWGCPATSLLASGGWLYVYLACGPKMILLSLAWLALGVLSFLLWARVEKTWPFGPKDIREEFLEASRR
jgi:hypothetical protein